MCLKTHEPDIKIALQKTEEIKIKLIQFMSNGRENNNTELHSKCIQLYEQKLQKEQAKLDVGSKL